MKHVKLFEQFINEAKSLPLDKLVKMIGDKPSCSDLADFIYVNYDKVTGLRKSMRNQEGYFPSEIEDLVDHYGFDIIDFTDCYSMAAELNEKKYSDEERKELEQKGMAMPGGRFPVKDSTDLKNAIWLLPKAKGNVDDVIKYLAKRLKELGATNYENMFNKTLHTMGIDKDISHYAVSESVRVDEQSIGSMKDLKAHSKKAHDALIELWAQLSRGATSTAQRNLSKDMGFRFKISADGDKIEFEDTHAGDKFTWDGQRWK